MSFLRPPFWRWRALAWLVLMAGVVAAVRVHAARLEAAPGGVIESGTPAYELLSTELLGLDTMPTDLREMPDGKILLVAGTQLAIGDGVRWQVFEQGAGAQRSPIYSAGVDRDGSIYVAKAEGVAKVVFWQDGRWYPEQLIEWPAQEQGGPRLLPQATMTDTGEEWLWHSLSGAIVSWRPGRAMQIRGFVNTFEHAFELEGKLYISERADGALWRVDAAQREKIKAEGTFSTVTSSVLLESGRMLVGTYGRGVQVFDGREMTEFAGDEALASGGRVNELCRTPGGLLAAAVDNFGILFFRENGKTVEVLDRVDDSRFTRIKRIVSGRGGIVWGLMDSGVLRIQFPANVSHFETRFGQGITTAHPYRFDGQLWILADGRLFHAVYNRSGRMVRLDLDSPAGLFVNAFSGATGLAVAGTEQGAYLRTADGWEVFAPEIKHLRVLTSQPIEGAWLYSARNEIGWLRRNGDTLVCERRQPVANLTNVYNKPVTDGQGRIWLELGIGRIGCVELAGGEPRVRIYTGKEGLPESWPQLFVLDGTLAVNMAETIWKFDEAAQRFVPDGAFTARVPGVTKVFGRPGIDAMGRLWIVVDGELQLRNRRNETWSEITTTVSPGFAPYYLTFESDGVVWLHAQHRLARYNPRMPELEAPPLGAHFTQLSLAGGKRHLFALDEPIAALPFEENSLVARFLASGNTFGAPVNFEVKLEGGASAEWVSVGSAGSAALDRLKEGSYVFRVRPRLGRVTGREDTLAFTIQPPWFRTPLAYVSYGLAGLGLVAFMVWLSTHFERREKNRLERLVAERTSELRHSNLQLAGQMDEIRNLTQAINQSPVALFITTPEGLIEYTNPRSCLLSGYTAAQLIGSDLNRLRTQGDTEKLTGEVRAALARGEAWEGVLTIVNREGRPVLVRSIISPIFNQEGRVRHHLYLESDITEWREEQQRRRRLEAQLSQAQKIESLGTLAGGIAHDFNNILTGILGYCELARMAVDEQGDVRSELQQIRTAGLRAKDLVKQILTFSRKQQTEHTVLDLSRPVAEALKLIRATTPATIEIKQELAAGNIKGDPSQIHQIVVNLCTNAVHAIGDAPGQITVLLRPVLVDEAGVEALPGLKPGACLQLTIQDTGHGMDAATLERIFDPFFTTKPQGKGTGLGLSIVQGVIASHGGALQVFSEPSVGTTFELFFPLVTESVATAVATHEPPMGAGQEVLLVDDEALVAEFSVARLRHFGYRPTHFTDPRDALRTFQLRPQRFAAIITDLTMPHLTGLDLLDEIRAVRADIPAIVLTGYGSDTAREKIRRLPLCALLQKPFSGEDLVHLLGQLLQSRPANRPETPPSPHRPSRTFDQGN